MFSLEEIVGLVADAYYGAASASADMRATTDALESIRTKLVSASDPFDSWNLIDDRIGRAEPDRLRPVLMQFRERFEQMLKTEETTRMAELFLRDEKLASTEWLRLYARALASWRFDFCVTLADAVGTRPSKLQPNVEEMRKFTKRAMDARWAEAFPLFNDLGQNENVPPEERMELLVVAGKIELYHFLNPARAKEFFEKGEKLTPDHGTPKSALGEYWLQQNEIDKARECCKGAIELSPDVVDGYLHLGECYEKSGDLAAAEASYQDAIRQSPGASEGYTWLLRLHGQPMVFSEHKDRIPRLLRDIAAIDSSNEYSSFTDTGYIYEQNKDLDEAHHWYEKAINQDPSQVNGYISNGYAYLAEEQYDRASDNFQKAIEVAPEAFDGYWAMSWLYEQRQDWTKAIDFLEQSLQRRPEWKLIIKRRLPALYRQLGDYKKAEEESMALLETEPTNKQTIGILEGIAQDYYQKANDPDAALRILSKLRETQGSSYEATYQNYVGNLRYYFGEYDKAVDAYRRACEFGPENAVYHSNLSLALEGSTGPQDLKLAGAVEALRKARRLSPGAADYAQRLEKLELRQGLLKAYGDALLQFIPIVTPIGVGVGPALLPYFVDITKSALLSETLELIEDLRRRIQEHFGIQIPGVRFRELQEPGLPEGSYIFSLAEVFVASGIAKPEEKFSEGVSKVGQHNGRIFIEVKPVFMHLERVIRENLAEFLGHDQVMMLIQEHVPDVHAHLLAHPDELAELTSLLRSLLGEEVPITAVESIVRHWQKSRADRRLLLDIAEQARSLPDVRAHLPGNQNGFHYYRLGIPLEKLLQESVSARPPVLAISPLNCHYILEALRDRTNNDIRVALVVRNPQIRPFLRELTKFEFPQMPVLTETELRSGFVTKIAGEIELPEERNTVK